MKHDEPAQENYDVPVAYDAEGRPLYAHPAAVQQVVHIARAVDPIKQEVSDATKKRHEESVQAYPALNLSEHEYVISAVRRHPIGLIIPLAFGVLLLAITLTILFNFSAIVELLDIQGLLSDTSIITVPLLLFCLAIGLGMFVVYYVYVSNKFYLTNESVIQEIQLSLFSRHEQTVSLGNIEDASYYQQGILQQLINYGSIRLSTQGDETTYRFTYVANPKQHIATLNNAVEAFKNGRPIEG